MTDRRAFEHPVTRLRTIRLRAAYVLERLRIDAKLRDLGTRLEAHCRSIDRRLDQANDLELREIQASARLSMGEDENDETQLQKARAAIALLREERATLDARLRAEIAAYCRAERGVWRHAASVG